MKQMGALLTLFFTFFTTVHLAYNSTGPTWLPSPYFRAGNNRVILTKTAAGQQTYYTFTFSSALSGIPNLAYGVKNYRGCDTMLTESFEILRRNLTSSLFTVSIEIFGVTNIFVLTVPYLAIDLQFPHHLNSFDNVPINYTSVPLTNFSSKVNALTSYTNTINYTLQSSANRYKVFTDPLSSNKIVLFLTSFEINGTASSAIDFSVVVNVLNSSHYRWTVTIDRNAYVGKVHFSLVVYNQDDVKSSKLYAIVYYEWISNIAGNYSFTSFPQELTDNMITALVDFNAIAGNSAIEYNWQFVSNFMGSNYVIYQNQSLPSKSGPFTSSANCGLNRTKSSVFYIKTWECGAPYVYFNITSDNCQDACADYFYQNSTSATCEKCFYKCLSCSEPNNQTSCQTCQPGFNRSLANGSCVCNTEYFDDWYSLACRACSTVDANCLACQHLFNSSKSTSDYQSIFASASWPTTIKPDYKCLLCKSSYFLNSSNLCQSCPLNYCTQCLNLTACQTCNSSAKATKYTNNLCYLCNVANCIMCNADNVCVTCETGYFVSSGSCQSCATSCTCDGWVLPKVSGVCSTLCGDGFKIGNEECDNGNTNDHDGCSSTCMLEPCNQNCSCDGWVHPWTNDSCSTLCGDSIPRGQEECDDGNTDDHDGCSSRCTIEPCNINCSCDGWHHPWTNGACSVLCGDSLIRGSEQCDDGNQNDHYGCSSTCELEPCNISCLCDRRAQPWINDSCQTLCGDNLVRGVELCDNGNTHNYDFCDENCTWIFIEQANDTVMLTSSMSMYPALALFVMGFRIVGLQALNVFQSFQLLLYAQNIDTFNISFNIHGYSDQTYFPLEIPVQNFMFNRFNFMYLVLIGFFLIGAAMQLYQKAKSNNNRITNIYSDDQNNDLNDKKTVKNQSELTSEDSYSDDLEDFTVHYKKNHQNANKTKQIIKIIEPNGQKSRTYLPFLSISTGSTMFRQIFFDFVFNCLYIFVYGLVIQIMQQSFKSLLEFETMMVVGSTLFVLVLAVLTISVENESFGENQLKFHQNRAAIYWALVLFERITFSALLALSTRYQICIFVLLGIKLIILLIHMCSNLYFESIQKVRSVVTHFMHFLLILLFVLNHIFLEPMRILDVISSKFIQFTYAGILGLVLLICLGFWTRQIIKKFRADFRDHESLNSEEQDMNESHVSAVFDVRKQYSIEDNLGQFNQSNLKSKNNIFDDLKTVDYIPRPSESDSPTKLSQKSKKVVSIHYLNYLNATNSSQLSPKSGKSNVSYMTHRRKNAKYKKHLNIFEHETNHSDELKLKSFQKSKKSYFGEEIQNLEAQTNNFEKKRTSIDKSIQQDELQNTENVIPKTNRVLAKEILRVGIKNHPNKKSNGQKVLKQQQNSEQKEQTSASDLIKNDLTGSKYQTLAIIFHEPRKQPKKRTYAHKRYRHGKKQENGMLQTGEISNERTENFDTFEAVSINFDD